MSIEKINTALPPTDKIEDLNEQTLELEGLSTKGQFDKYEIQEIYSGCGLTRKYKRDYSFGDAATGSSAWYHWKHLKAESGYSIWEYDYDIDYAHVDENKLYFDDKLCTYKGDASAMEITKFDKVLVDNGSGYIDDTIEAGTEGGIAFDLIDSISEYLYIGSLSVFGGIDFNFGTRGSNYTLKVEYSNGTIWTQLTANANDLDDNTSNFKHDGVISYTIPSDWLKNTVNNLSYYWIRISTTTTPVTTASATSILPYNSVPGLLSLSSIEFQNENWKWCSMNITGTGGRLFLTIKNTGDSAYEGDDYITSASSHSNKENFFHYNRKITGDFQDENWSSNYLYNTLSFYIPGTIVTGTGIKGFRFKHKVDLDEVYLSVNEKVWSLSSGSHLYIDMERNNIKIYTGAHITSQGINSADGKYERTSLINMGLNYTTAQDLDIYIAAVGSSGSGLNVILQYHQIQ